MSKPSSIIDKTQQTPRRIIFYGTPEVLTIWDSFLSWQEMSCMNAWHQVYGNKKKELLDYPYLFDIMILANETYTIPKEFR